MIAPNTKLYVGLVTCTGDLTSLRFAGESVLMEMLSVNNFTDQIEKKVREQLGSQRVGYLLGAGSSYLDGAGYPLAFELWGLIKDRLPDESHRTAIQSKLDGGAAGLENALDLLD